MGVERFVAEILDVAAKLGPVVIAFMVYRLGVISHRSNVASAARQAELLADQNRVADQGFRLQLLDRRISTYAKVKLVAGEYMQTGHVTLEMAQTSMEAFEDASAVFDSDTLVQLEGMRNLTANIYYLKLREINMRASGHQEKADAFMEQTFAAEDKLMPLLSEIAPILREKMRVIDGQPRSA